MSLPFSTIVKWNRFYFISLAYFLLGVILMQFSRTASVIFFLLLLTFWSAIPGWINIHLIEVDIYEMVFTIMAINFGGFLAALVAIPYLLLGCLVSVQFQPKEAIRFSLGAVVTLPLMPFIYSYFGNNLLLTLYSFTIISYTIFLLVTIFFMTGLLLDTIRYMFLALPIAFLTNTLYVKVFGDPMLALFDANFELKLTLPFIIGAFLLVITGLKIFAWYLKKLDAKYKREQKPVA